MDHLGGSVGARRHPIDGKLSRLLPAHGWESRNDYPYLKSSQTPYGEIAFNDGVQNWINPRLEQGGSPHAD